MYVHLPDPHPGRCANLRRDGGDPYGTTMKRCLKRDGHESRCQFPPDSTRPDVQYANQITYGGAATPKPWVVPEGVGD